MVTEVVVTKNEELALSWPEKAKALVVTDQATYEQAANLKKDIAALRKAVIEDNEKPKSTAWTAHKAACEHEKKYLDPLVEAERILVGAIKKFEDDQRRIQQENQRRIDAEQRERDEADRKRREEEALVAWRADQKRQAELRAADDAARLAAAEEAQVVGASEDTVDQILETQVIDVPEVAPVAAYMEPAVYTPPPVAAPTFERMKGLGVTRRWKARVVDIKRLCAAVASGAVSETYVTANMVALNQRATADKGAMKNQIPGVIAVEE